MDGPIGSTVTLDEDAETGELIDVTVEEGAEPGDRPNDESRWLRLVQASAQGY